jgi:hypothetical protein
MNTPEFDPRRSAAIRSMLEDVVLSTPSGGGASARPRPSRRTTILVALAVLVGLVASGTTAVALTGGSLFGLGAPVATVAPVTPTPTPTPIPTPTPTPTPTAPPAPAAPVVRVPATCDDLLPQSTAEGILQTAVESPPVAEFANPLFYTDRRVGALQCTWVVPGDSESASRPSVALSIVPGVSESDYTDYLNGEAWAGAPAAPDISPTAYEFCSGDQTEYTVPRSCFLTAYLPGYAISFASGVGADAVMTDAQRAETRATFAGLVTAASAFAAPPPLWQPSSTTLTGATSCDGLIDIPTLTGVLGVPVREFKGEGGEYSNASYHSARQVNAFWCSWTEDTPTGTASSFAAVLPGGASYFAESAAADPSIGWTPTTDYPGEAYLSADGTQVSILIDGAWVKVRAPADSLAAVTEVVLANVGAS